MNILFIQKIIFETVATQVQLLSAPTHPIPSQPTTLAVRSGRVRRHAAVSPLEPVYEPFVTKVVARACQLATTTTA